MSTDAQARDHAGIGDDVQRIIEQTETVRESMLALHDRLPASSEETSLRDLTGTPPVPARIRADLRCLLADAIEPALRGLRRIASYVTRS